jgi:hypothetical protein
MSDAGKPADTSSQQPIQYEEALAKAIGQTNENILAIAEMIRRKFSQAPSPAWESTHKHLAEIKEKINSR